jgi:hypothetical protein
MPEPFSAWIVGPYGVFAVFLCVVMLGVALWAVCPRRVKR